MTPECDVGRVHGAPKDVRLNCASGAGDSRSPSNADFLGCLFASLDASNVRYCVLHSWEDLPDHLPSDLDLAVHPDDARNSR